MATATPGLALAILTADCVPVLLADREAGVIGAAHAGWRGALNGVVEAAVEAMLGLGARAKDIRAVIGPAIGAASYEVGPEFPAPFLARKPEDEDLFAPAEREGHFLFDITGYVARCLSGLGLAAVGATGGDTCAEAAASSAIAGASTAASPTMDETSPSWRSTGKMPYVIIFGVLLFVGLVASCVLTASGP